MEEIQTKVNRLLEIYKITISHKKELDELNDIIKDWMIKNNKTSIPVTNGVVVLKVQKSKRFDITRIKEEHPQVYAAFCKQMITPMLFKFPNTDIDSSIVVKSKSDLPNDFMANLYEAAKLEAMDAVDLESNRTSETVEE